MELEDTLGKFRELCECGQVHSELFLGGWNDYFVIKDIIKHWIMFGKIVYGEILF